MDVGVVLAGGEGRRLGGVDKAALDVGGVPLLERVLAALGPDVPVVAVGPVRATSRAVRWTREEPPGGGPAAAVGAALPLLAAVPGPARVALLAVDLPFLGPEVLALLSAALRPGDDGALLVDEGGRRQLLCGVWRLDALRRAVAAAGGDCAGVPLRRLLAPLVAREVSALPHPGTPAPWVDCDTADDLAAARRASAPPTEGAP